MTIEEKYALIDEPCTLDGAPAVLRGAHAKFPVVRRLDGKSGDVAFAWETVAHIMSGDRAFRSR